MKRNNFIRSLFGLGVVAVMPKDSDQKIREFFNGKPEEVTPEPKITCIKNGKLRTAYPVYLSNVTGSSVVYKIIEDGQ